MLIHYPVPSGQVLRLPGLISLLLLQIILSTFDGIAARGTAASATSLTVTVPAKTPDHLEAPVLISPNNDGKNDYFVIKGIATLNKTTGEKISNKLTILDR